MGWGWLLFPLGFALADWGAVWNRYSRVRLLTKPLVLLALLAGFTWQRGWQAGMLWFGIGLLASLAGDVFLLFPRRFFMAGLASFLAAHAAYTIAFQPWSAPLGLEAAAVVLLVAVLAGLIFPPVLRGLAQAGRKRLRLPFSLYALAISLMLISALTTLFRPDWPPLAGGLSAAGAGLFFLSDSVLATHRFARRLPAGDLIIMLTYHLGQLALVSGALLRYQP